MRGNAAAAGTIAERTFGCVLARSKPAVSSVAAGHRRHRVVVTGRSAATQPTNSSAAPKCNAEPLSGQRAT